MSSLLLRIRCAMIGAILLSVCGSAAFGSEPVRRPGFRLDGFLVEAGIVDPVHGTNGAILGASAGLGTLFVPWLDLDAGFRWWSTDIDRSAFGSGVDGQFSDFNVYADLKYQLFRVRGLKPFLAAGIGGHVVGADIPKDRSLEDALTGFKMGVHMGLGLATTRPGLGLRFLARRDFVEDAGNWNFTLGAGWWPKSRPRADERRISVIRNSPVPVTMAAPQASAPPAAQQTQPAAATPPASPQTDATLQELLRQQKTMATELDSLRQALSNMRAAPAQAAPVEPAAPAPLPAPVDRQAEFQKAVQRLALLSGQPEALRETAGGFVFSPTRSLKFTTASDQLPIEGLEEIRRVAALLLRFPEVSLLVAGHTDSMGNPDHNQQLSQRRAETVRAELLRLGVQPARVEAIGHGSGRPLGDNATREGRAQNRRVELIMTW
jgi:outer membrane protein OmpA-like peptidoglycan-associated protein